MKWRSLMTPGVDEHYGTADELEGLGKRRVRSQTIDRENVPLMPVDILDEGLVEVEPGQGYCVQGCVGSCDCEDAYNAECAHTVVDQIRELEQMLVRRPEFAEDPLFRQKVAAACEYARMMSEVIDIIDAEAASVADRLELRFGL